jgi:hypothetical protein
MSGFLQDAPRCEIHGTYLRPTAKRSTPQEIKKKSTNQFVKTADVQMKTSETQSLVPMVPMLPGLVEVMTQISQGPQDGLAPLPYAGAAVFLKPCFIHVFMTIFQYVSRL